jgi:hypothetical protein
MTVTNKTKAAILKRTHQKFTQRLKKNNISGISKFSSNLENNMPFIHPISKQSFACPKMEDPCMLLEVREIRLTI